MSELGGVSVYICVRLGPQVNYLMLLIEGSSLKVCAYWQVSFEARARVKYAPMLDQLVHSIKFET